MSQPYLTFTTINEIFIKFETNELNLSIKRVLGKEKKKNKPMNKTIKAQGCKWEEIDSTKYMSYAKYEDT